MEPTKVKRALEILDGAHGLSDGELQSYLGHICGQDSTLYLEVLSYLQHDLNRTVLAGGMISGEAPEIPLSTRADIRYELGDEIARGGMGVVLRAFDTNIRRHVALKVLKTTAEKNPEVVRRFLLEAQIGGQLQHPGIAPVYEIGRFADGRPFIAMKLVKGATLGHLLGQRAGPDDDQAKYLGIFEQVCQAMAFAHSRGVIHRDLKPANVMVGEFREVQIMDWGIAKLLTDDLPEPSARDQQGQGLDAARDVDSVDSKKSNADTDALARQTRVGRIMGTPGYMPPEQLIGRAARTADVYALGVILGEILTGEMVSGDPAKAGELFDQRGCDQQLARLVTDCLQTDPNDRPSDASVVASTISSYLDAIQSRLREAEITTARAQVKAEDERELRRRTLWIVAILAVVLITAAVGGPIIAYQQKELKQDAFQARTLAEQRSRDTDEARTLAEERAEEVQRNLYFAEMILASQVVMESGGIRRLSKLTSKWVPEAGEKDLRGWEWHYLDRLTRADSTSYKSHGRPVRSIAWCPIGDRVVSADKFGVIKVWDPDSHRTLVTVKGHATGVNSLSWHPRGKRFASGEGDGTVRIWDGDSGQILLNLPPHEGRVKAVRWSPDGKRLASGGDDGVIRIAGVDGGDEIVSIPSRSGAINALDWSPDSARIVTVGSDDIIKVWNIDSHENLWNARENREIRAVAWSPDGRLIAWQSGDRSIVIHDAQTGENLVDLTGHSHTTGGLAWSTDGQYLASAGWDNTLRVWEVAKRKVRSILRREQGVVAVSWSPNSEQVAYASDNYVGLFDALRDDTLTLRGHQHGVTSVRWHPDNHRLLSASKDKSVRIWGTDKGEPISIFNSHSGIVRGAAWSPDAARIASVSNDGNAVVWDAETGAIEHLLDGQSGPVSCLGWSPDGIRLATAGRDWIVRIWDTELGTELAALKLERVLKNAAINSLSWSPDGKWLAVPSGKGSILIWETATFRQVRQLKCARGAIKSLKWNPRGDRIAVAAGSGALQILSDQDGADIVNLLGHDREVIDVAWSPDSARLASGGSDRSIRLWDTATGAPCLILRAHDQEVSSVAWSRDGKRLASASADGTIKVWDYRSEDDLPVTGKLAPTQKSGNRLIELEAKELTSR